MHPLLRILKFCEGSARLIFTFPRSSKDQLQIQVEENSIALLYTSEIEELEAKPRREVKSLNRGSFFPAELQSPFREDNLEQEFEKMDAVTSNIAQNNKDKELSEKIKRPSTKQTEEERLMPKFPLPIEFLPPYLLRKYYQDKFPYESVIKFLLGKNSAGEYVRHLT